MTGAGAVSGSSRVLLALAAVAVAFAAADTYVVVLALPDMMSTARIPINELQRAAPIVSGFLLGYVAMLPLIGRIADLRGRVPVLVMSLMVFAVGSLVTALAYDLPSMVVGRFLQGVGGGGLVPATLALVADLYPVERRGVPLGIVSAVQEIGSVVGPLFGALVLAVADWQAIFLINLAVALVLAAAIRRLAGGEAFAHHRTRGRPDYLGMAGRRGHRGGRRHHDGPATAAAARPDLGPAVHPVHRRGTLADPDRGDHDGRGAGAGAALPLRAAPVGRRTRLVRAHPAGRPGRRTAAGRRARRHHPRVRHRRPRGAGVLRAGALVPARLRGGLGGLPRPPAPGRGAADPPRCPPAGAGLGLAAGQLLRRLGADRRTDRHPDLRPDHHLPRVPADGGPGAGPLPGGAPGRRRRGRLPHPPGAGRRGHRGRNGLLGGRLRADGPVGQGLPWSTCRSTAPCSCAASASGWHWRRSTPRCWPAPTTTCTASPPPWWSSPG